MSGAVLRWKMRWPALLKPEPARLGQKPVEMAVGMARIERLQRHRGIAPEQPVEIDIGARAETFHLELVEPVDPFLPAEAHQREAFGLSRVGIVGRIKHAKTLVLGNHRLHLCLERGEMNRAALDRGLGPVGPAPPPGCCILGAV
jgi:hypothetical protein